MHHEEPRRLLDPGLPRLPFGNLPLDIQAIVTAADWLGAAEAVSALVCAEPGEVVDRIEEGVRGGQMRH